MSAHEVLISLQNVSLSYTVRAGVFGWSKYTPLNDISFELHRGETVGIVGRNGAGKSTLLRLIAGIIEPDVGHVVNHGARVSLLSLGVGFVPHLSGRENAMEGERGRYPFIFHLPPFLVDLVGDTPTGAPPFFPAAE